MSVCRRELENSSNIDDGSPSVGGSLEIFSSINDDSPSVGGSLEISDSIDDDSLGRKKKNPVRVGGSLEMSNNIDDDSLGRKKKPLSVCLSDRTSTDRWTHRQVN
jgi:hypothetical protein